MRKASGFPPLLSVPVPPTPPRLWMLRRLWSNKMFLYWFASDAVYLQRAVFGPSANKVVRSSVPCQGTKRQRGGLVHVRMGVAVARPCPATARWHWANARSPSRRRRRRHRYCCSAAHDSPPPAQTARWPPLWASAPESCPGRACSACAHTRIPPPGKASYQGCTVTAPRTSSSAREATTTTTTTSTRSLLLQQGRVLGGQGACGKTRCCRGRPVSGGLRWRPCQPGLGGWCAPGRACRAWGGRLAVGGWRRKIKVGG